MSHQYVYNNVCMQSLTTNGQHQFTSIQKIVEYQSHFYTYKVNQSLGNV